MNIKSIAAIKIAHKLDIYEKYALADKFFKLALDLSNTDESKFDLKLGGEGSSLNDPKNAEDYFLGIAFDVVANNKKDKQTALKEMNKMLELQNQNLSENEKIDTNSDFWQNMLSKLNDFSWWINSPDMPEKTYDSKNNVESNPNKFIEKLSLPAQQASNKFDNIVPASFIIALAAWESGWGKSDLASQYNNYFGIKDSSTSGGKGSVTMSTYEYYDGEKQREQANFAKFEDDSVASMAALPNFLINNKRYSDALYFGSKYATSKSKTDLHNFIDEVFNAGYSTDDKEPGNIKKLIDNYNLTRFDI